MLMLTKKINNTFQKGKEVKTMKKLLVLVAVMFLAVFAVNAQAATISFNGVPQTFTGDFNVNGLVVDGWTIDATFAATKPVIGSTTAPTMDILSFDAASTGASPLIIDFSDSGFTYTGGLDTAVGGSSIGLAYDATFSSYINGGLVSSLGPFTNLVAFSGSDVKPVSLASGDLLEMIAVITPKSAGQIGFNFKVEPAAVPEPATMLLLGSGLLGVGFFARRRKS